MFENLNNTDSLVKNLGPIGDPNVVQRVNELANRFIPRIIMLYRYHFAFLLVTNE